MSDVRLAAIFVMTICLGLAAFILLVEALRAISAKRRERRMQEVGKVLGRVPFNRPPVDLELHVVDEPDEEERPELIVESETLRIEREPEGK